MPSRIVREGINSSELVNSLSPLAELFYRRLMSVVDDFGRFYAAPATLLGACWPTHPEKVCLSDVSQWLAECAHVTVKGKKLLRVYSVENCMYLEITNFQQRIRAGKSRFPQCPSNGSQMTVTCQTTDGSSRISYFVFRETEGVDAMRPPAAAAAPCPDASETKLADPPNIANGNGNHKPEFPVTDSPLRELAKVYREAGRPTTPRDWQYAGFAVVNENLTDQEILACIIPFARDALAAMISPEKFYSPESLLTAKPRPWIPLAKPIKKTETELICEAARRGMEKRNANKP